MIIKEFGGVSAYVEEVKVEEHFEERYNDAGYLFLLGKKEFQHEEEGLNFKYRYAIRVLDLEELSGEEGAPINIGLWLIPSPESLCEEIRESMISTIGDEDIDYFDVAEYGISVRMADEYLEGIKEDKYNLYDIEAIRERIEAITATYESVNSLRGFYLDRIWNRMGVTGWDTLNNAINNEPLFKF